MKLPSLLGSYLEICSSQSKSPPVETTENSRRGLTPISAKQSSTLDDRGPEYGIDKNLTTWSKSGLSYVNDAVIFESWYEVTLARVFCIGTVQR